MVLMGGRVHIPCLLIGIWIILLFTLVLIIMSFCGAIECSRYFLSVFKHYPYFLPQAISGKIS